MARMNEPLESLDAAGAAMPAGLAFTSDARPGIRRERRGKGFSYRDAQGRLVRDAGEIARIRKLAIPPAYVDVWICPRPDGHLQATGRDARGRKQYRYHPQWREERDCGKYNRMRDFAAALPAIRRRVAADLKAPPLSRQRVLATMVRLLDTTFIRVGNDEYARENGSFGLTTLRNRHARLVQDALVLSFRGKSGVLQEVQVRDPQVIEVVRSCLHLPGQELFQYRDGNGELRTVGSGDINSYLQDMAGGRFTAKDFRTWHGTVMAWQALRKACAAAQAGDGAAVGAGAPRFTMKEWLATVARRLGNTPAVCRKAYIHTDVLHAAVLLTSRGADLEGLHRRMAAPISARRGLCVAERALLAFLASAPSPQRKAGRRPHRVPAR